MESSLQKQLGGDLDKLGAPMGDPFGIFYGGRYVRRRVDASTVALTQLDLCRHSKPLCRLPATP